MWTEDYIRTAQKSYVINHSLNLLDDICNALHEVDEDTGDTGKCLLRLAGMLYSRRDEVDRECRRIARTGETK